MIPIVSEADTPNIGLLVRAGCSGDVIAHCVAVSRIALTIAEQVNVPVDKQLVREGSLFHDIGRARTHGIEHALAGVDIGKELRFSDKLLHVIERHIGAGITAQEAERLGLPKREYLPVTPEEKIVSYADNLVSGVRTMAFQEALERFRRLLGADHDGVGLFIQQHHEIQEWMQQRTFDT